MILIFLSSFLISCWLEATFSLDTPAAYKIAGVNMACPGVEAANIMDRKVYHKFYQWVVYTIFFQCLMFYAPKYAWKAKENDRLHQLITKLKENELTFGTSETPNASKLVQSFADTLDISNEYFYCFFWCEVFYFFHLIVQIWFTNFVLQGSFLWLGV